MGRITRCVAAAAVVAAPFLYHSQPAQAVTFGFSALTKSKAGEVGERQFSVDVRSLRDGIFFEFGNTGPTAAAVTDVYLYATDGLLGNYIRHDNVGQVRFLPGGAEMTGLPGGEYFGLTTPVGFDARGRAGNELNIGEFLGLVFAPGAGVTVETIIAAMNAGLLRIGLRARLFGIDGEPRESFVTGPGSNGPTPVPLPASIALLLAGIGSLGALGALRKRAKPA